MLPLSLRFLHQNPLYAYRLTHMCDMHRLSQSSQFNHLNNTVWAAPSLSTCSFLHSRHLILLRPKHNTTLSLLKPSINTTPQTYLRVSQIHTLLTFQVGGGNSCGGYNLMRVAKTCWLKGLWSIQAKYNLPSWRLHGTGVENAVS